MSVPNGVVCKTMLSQRPGGMMACVRPECNGTNAGTEIGSVPPPGAVRLVREGQGTYALVGLSVAHVERLQDALDRVSLSDPIGLELQKIIYDS
jgi:hypothetical protein